MKLNDLHKCSLNCLVVLPRIYTYTQEQYEKANQLKDNPFPYQLLEHKDVIEVGLSLRTIL